MVSPFVATIRSGHAVRDDGAVDCAGAARFWGSSVRNWDGLLSLGCNPMRH